MTLVLAFALCVAVVVAADTSQVLVGDANSILSAARNAANVHQFVTSLGTRVSWIDESNTDPLLELQSHERPELHIFSTLLLQRAFAGCLGIIILLYTTRTFWLARQRRLYGLRSSVALPLDYRLQKRLVKANRSGD